MAKRLRFNDSNSDSPVHKKPYFNMEKEAEKLGISLPSDDATELDWHKAIFGQLIQLTANTANITSKVETNTKDIAEMKSDVVTNTTEIAANRQEISNLCAENAELKEGLLKLDCDQRKLNLVFDGIKDYEGMMDHEVRDELVSALNNIRSFHGNARMCQIDTARRLGKKIGTRPRPLLVTFNWNSDVTKILEGRVELPSGVYVREDHPVEIENRRKQLYPIFRKAKRMDSYKGTVKLDKDKLIIKGKVYTVAPTNNLIELPDDISPERSCERENANVSVFFGSGSPLSNIHPVVFSIDGIEYKSTEQYIQSKKAKMFDDDATHRKILLTDSPYEAKKLGYKVKGFIMSKWKENCEGVAMKGCLAKFQQSSFCRHRLLAKSNKKIGEASEDPIWGVGMKISNRDVMHEQNWTGQNIMGKVLERVLDVLK